MIWPSKEFYEWLGFTEKLEMDGAYYIMECPTPSHPVRDIVLRNLATGQLPDSEKHVDIVLHEDHVPVFTLLWRAETNNARSRDFLIATIRQLQAYK
jgi:hypothetical protein